MDRINIGNPSNDRVGSRLREARVSKGYSVNDLAIATGLTNAEISAVEDGRSSNADHVQRMKHALS